MGSTVGHRVDSEPSSGLSVMCSAVGDSGACIKGTMGPAFASRCPGLQRPLKTVCMQAWDFFDGFYFRAAIQVNFVFYTIIDLKLL